MVESLMSPAVFAPSDEHDISLRTQADSGDPASIRRRDTMIVAIAVALVHYIFTARKTVMTLAPDEMATVGVARYLSGGKWTMFVSNVYRPGMATLLTPLFMVVNDPTWLIRCSLMAAAVVSGATVFWLAPLIARLTSLNSNSVLVVVALISLSPSSLVASSFLWAEPLVTLSFLAALLATVRFYEHPVLRHALPAVLWPVVGYASHGRLLPLVPITTTAVVIAALRHRRHVLAGTSAVAAAVALVATVLYARWVYSNVWILTGSENTTGGVLTRLSKPLQVLDAATGQLWYLLCATGLLFGFGIVILFRRAFRERSVPGTVDARIVITLVVPMIFVSIIFMSDRTRPDYLIYGRYNDAVIGPVIGVGVGWLRTERMRESRRFLMWMVGGIVAVTAEMALVLQQVHYTQLASRPQLNQIAGIAAASRHGRIEPLVVTAAALTVAAIWWLAASHRRPGVVVGVGVVSLALVGLRMWVLLLPNLNVWSSAQAVTEIDKLGISSNEPIGVLVMPDEYGPDIPLANQTDLAMVYEWFLPNHPFRLDFGPQDEFGPYVVATTHDALLTRYGGTIVWQDPERSMAIWREP